MILFPERMKQLIDFENMNFNNCKPTDIDGMIEYRNLAYIFFELKHNGHEFPKGQRLALERLVKDTANTKVSIAIVADHYTEPSETINAKDCIVREIYISTEKRWRSPKFKISLDVCIHDFLSYYVRGE